MHCKIKSFWQIQSQWLKQGFRTGFWICLLWKHLEVTVDKASAVALEWRPWSRRLFVHTVVMMHLRIGMWLLTHRSQRITIKRERWLCLALALLLLCTQIMLPAADLVKHHFHPFIHTHCTHSHTHADCHLSALLKNVCSITLTGA